MSDSDHVLGTIAKVATSKGFSRKRGKKSENENKNKNKNKKEDSDDKAFKKRVKEARKPTRYPLKFEGRDHTHTKVYQGPDKDTDKKSKIGAEGLLPVQKINDGEIWSDRKVAEEVQRALLPQQTTKIVKADIAPKFLQTTQVTAEHVKRWIPKGVVGIRGRDPGYRKSDRLYPNGENKKWAIPIDFFLVATNTIEGDQFMTESPDTRKYGMDVANIIYENILQFGRRTLDELLEDMGAWQPELVSLVANGMINDHYLKIVEEEVVDPITEKPIKDKNGKKIMLQTMELVEQNERLERMKKYSKQLEDKKAARRKALLKK